jgi:ACS family tartrate transporter-like MFS transporter
MTSVVDLASAVAKARRRLIPFLFLLYIVAYLDRVNVGFASLQMNAALGLSARAYAWGAGIFFFGYTAFEIPSNVILARIGARLWIGRIMITWGIISAAMMFVRNATDFQLMRLALGVAEAGFFPGIIFYLTRWFPERERARTIAAFMTAVLGAGIIGGPISGSLLSLDGARGLAGWQWLFLLEGIPAVVLGLIVLGALPERPEDAGWLTDGERLALTTRLAEEARIRGSAPQTSWAALRSGRIWLLALVYFTVPVALYAMSFWLPQILKAASGGSDFAVGVLSAMPYTFGAIGMVLAGRHSDRTGERRWHVAVAAAFGGAAFAGSAFTSSLLPSVVLLSLAMLGLASMFGPFWTIATSAVRGVGAAAGIALINSVGNIGGFVGPYLLGSVRDATGGFTWGLVGVGAILAIGGLLVMAVRE